MECALFIKKPKARMFVAENVGAANRRNFDHALSTFCEQRPSQLRFRGLKISDYARYLDETPCFVWALIVCVICRFNSGRRKLLCRRKTQLLGTSPSSHRT